MTEFSHIGFGIITRTHNVFIFIKASIGIPTRTEIITISVVSWLNSGASETIAIGSGNAAQSFKIEGVASPIDAGTMSGFTLTVMDGPVGTGNMTTNYDGMITFSAPDDPLVTVNDLPQDFWVTPQNVLTYTRNTDFDDGALTQTKVAGIGNAASVTLDRH